MQNKRWWDAAAIAVASVIVLITLIDPPYGPDEWGACASTGAFLVVYFAYARRHLGTERMGHHLAISIAFAVVLAVGSSFEPSFATLQTFLYPFVWSTAPTLRSAIIANVVIAVAVVVGYVVHFGPAGLLTGLAIAALSFGFSMALGLWITRIAEHGAERGRLLDELQAAQGQLAAMHRDAGVTDERARLAREIHDTIAQSLTGLVMVAQRAGNRLEPISGEAAASARGDIDLIERMARDALTEARGLVASLAPVSADGGLGAALQRLGTSFQRETGVLVTVSTDAPGLSREHEVVLLRAAQEGLANVRKHAYAAHATVSVETGDHDVVLSVRDDGVGPGRGTAAPGEHGFGLAGLRDRAALVGGSFAVESGESGGTVLRVVVPLPGDDESDAARPSGGTG
jgi:signal transduction histidine kinase